MKKRRKGDRRRFQQCLGARSRSPAANWARVATEAAWDSPLAWRMTRSKGVFQGLETKGARRLLSLFPESGRNSEAPTTTAKAASKAAGSGAAASVFESAENVTRAGEAESGAGSKPLGGGGERHQGEQEQPRDGSNHGLRLVVDGPRV